MSLSQRMAAIKAARDIEDKPKPVVYDPDLVPDTSSETDDPLDALVDGLINNIGIIDAYKRWVPGSIIEDPRGRTESIMCQCPWPGHQDEKPSAWVNTDKNYFHCAKCERGGDTLTLAALYYNYPTPISGQDFHHIRRAVAVEEGLSYYNDGNGMYRFYRPGNEPVKQPEPVETVAEAVIEAVSGTNVPETATIVEVTTPEEPDNTLYPTLNWRDIVPQDTFIYAAVDAMSSDDVPEEFHFWNAMVVVGQLLGRNITLQDRPRVLANLFVCILGQTGDGKSKSRRYFTEMVNHVSPYDKNDPTSEGIKFIGSPHSGEWLAESFIRYETAKGIKKPIGGNIKGIVDYGEFAELAAQMNRTGSSMVTTLQSLYDGDPHFSSGSMARGESTVSDAFCSMITTSQPKSLPELLSQREINSGLVNRIIFCTGGRKRQMSTNTFEPDLAHAEDLMKIILEWTEPERVLSYDPDALEMWDKFFHGTVYPMKSDESLLLIRTDLTMKKLMLIFTANMASADSTLNSIPVAAVQQAIKCWPYLIACYRLVDKSIGMTRLGELEGQILKKFQIAGPAGLSKRELRDKFNSGKNRDVDEIYKCVKLLQDMQIIVAIPPVPGKRGRPREAYVIA
jgi:hypothetical protein